MMGAGLNLSRPLAVVTPTVDADVLVVLAGASASFTGRQVHQISGRHSEKGVRNALQRLCLQGLVSRTPAGSADLYELNRDHLAAEHVLGLARMQAELWRRISAMASGWRLVPLYVAVFGSAARGDMNLDSDIDLFVVRPDGLDIDDVDWVSQMGNLSDRVTAWTGNDTRVLEMKVAEVRAGLLTPEPVLIDIQRQGLALFGSTDFWLMNSPGEAQ